MIDMEQLNISPVFLRTFRKAYELKNFTETARKLGMTQSGVSQHIGQIEAVLKAPLFERVGRALSPTRVGDRMYSFAGNWLSQMEDTVREIREGEQMLSGRITLGAPGSFGAFVLKPLVNWQAKNPGLVIEFEYGPNSVMERELKTGRMDIAVTSEPLDARNFINEEFFKQEFILVSHPSIQPRLASWEEFCSNPFIDYVGSENIFQKWIGAHYKKRIDPQQQLNFRVRVNNMESIFVLLEQKVGVTIFPKEPLLEFIRTKKLKMHKTGKVVENPLYLVSRQGQIFSRRIKALREQILLHASPNKL